MDFCYIKEIYRVIDYVERTKYGGGHMRANETRKKYSLVYS